MCKYDKIFFSIVIFFIFTCGYAFSAATGEPNVGEEAPDFILKGMDGKEVKLSSFKSVNKVVLIFGSCT
jgi:peroxiredoxin